MATSSALCFLSGPNSKYRKRRVVAQRGELYPWVTLVSEPHTAIILKCLVDLTP